MLTLSVKALLRDWGAGFPTERSPSNSAVSLASFRRLRADAGRVNVGRMCENPCG